MTARRSEAQRVIGWREWIALPDLGIRRIKVKVDTGARSSAIHALDIEPFRRGGKAMVRFGVRPIQRSAEEAVLAEARVLDERWVTNSGGRAEQRYVILTRVRFLDEIWPIELTLARRDTMGFRMLLGRQAVRGRFLVDPGHSFVGGKPKRKKKKVKKVRKKKKKKRHTSTDARSNVP